jgi:putative phosphoesterase
MVKLLVLADTHVRSVAELPSELIRAAGECDWLVHCGDYTGAAVIDELRALAKRFSGVYGNSDPGPVRARLPHKLTLEVDGCRLAVVHPEWGGFPDGIEAELLKRFAGYDAILFGHTHEPLVQRHGETLLVNPGQAYHSFMVPATMVKLTVSKGGIEGEVVTLRPG